MFDRGAAFFQAYADGMTVTPREFAVMIQTLIIGLAQQSILTPDEIGRQTVRNAFRVFGEGVRRR